MHDRLRFLFPFAVAIAIGVAAYLQAVGLSYVVEAALRARTRVPPSRLAAHAPAGPRQPVADAAPILDRNAFDSVTGALPKHEDERALHDSVAAREAGPCEDTRAVLIAASSDGWSFAMLVGADGAPQLRREGDLFGDRAVTAIGWDRVWLAHAGVRCEARLGRLPPKVPAPKPFAPHAPSTGVRQVGPAAYEVERRVLDRFLEDPRGGLGRRVRVSPDAGGVRVLGIGPDSPLAELGLQNGDRIESLNGMPLGTTEEALQAYARLRGAGELHLTITRKGKTQQLDYRIR